ncbi:hypothetical protein EDD15DRAFT_1472516 [Pisolithus albus]|nr:hypothetical protein EDD15DRAFT_1472516 [Pisolithus albus]
MCMSGSITRTLSTIPLLLPWPVGYSTSMTSGTLVPKFKIKTMRSSAIAIRSKTLIVWQVNSLLGVPQRQIGVVSSQYQQNTFLSRDRGDNNDGTRSKYLPPTRTKSESRIVSSYRWLAMW